MTEYCLYCRPHAKGNPSSGSNFLTTDFDNRLRSELVIDAFTVHVNILEKKDKRGLYGQ